MSGSGGGFPVNGITRRRLDFAFLRAMEHMLGEPRSYSTMKSGALTSVKLPADWSVETILPIEFEGRELTLIDNPSSSGDVVVHTFSLQ